MMASFMNSSITDDSVQDFCKDKISPPPKVKVTREKWANAQTQHKDKDFVIIQIGPQKRQAFRLYQDFINYKQEVCHRRNEVWIRRGATSDLATPEEIAKLVSGQPIYDDQESELLREKRLEFQKLSQLDKVNVIASEGSAILAENGYSEIADVEIIQALEMTFKLNDGYGSYIRYPVFWKMVDSCLLLICLLGCRESYPKQRMKELNRLSWQGFFNREYIPKLFSEAKRIKSVRKLITIPVITSVPRSRIQSYFQNWQWTGRSSHYYFQSLDLLGTKKQRGLLPTSVEVVIVDPISSVLEYGEKLRNLLITLPRDTTPLRNPPK